MKCFDINKSLTFFGNTYDASSGSPEKAFQGKTNRYWQTSGEGTDGDAVYIECDFGVDTTFDHIFIKDSNISNITLQRWNGAAFVTLTPSATISSIDGYNHLYTVTGFDYQKYRILGSNTIVADQEKRINEIYTFDLLGTFEIAPRVKVKRIKGQQVLELDNFLKSVINRGSRYEFAYKLLTNKQNDVDLFSEMTTRDQEFYIWMNDNEELIYIVSQAPFEFGDIFKMSNIKGDAPGYRKDNRFSAADNKAKFVEVA